MPAPPTHVFVLNLRGDTARLARVTEQLAAYRAVSVTRIEAIYGHAIPDDVCARLTNDPNAVNAKGALGCLLGHVHAWETILALGLDHAIVLEDDVALRDWAAFLAADPPAGFDLVFANDRTELLAPPDDGAWPRFHPIALSLPALEHRGSAVGSDCYVISREGARKLVGYFAADGYFSHIDLRLMAYALRGDDLPPGAPDGSMAHQIAAIHRSAPRAGAISAYGLYPALVTHPPNESSRDREDRIRGYVRETALPATTTPLSEPFVSFTTQSLVASAQPAIPALIHFVCDSDPDAAPARFGFVEYLAIKSAMRANPDCQVMVHCAREPQGDHWARLRLSVTVMPAPQIELGSDQAVARAGNRRLLMRLQALLDHGGTCLDFDTLCRKSFAPLRAGPVVLGLEAAENGAEPDSVSLAVMIAPPRSLFIRALLGSFLEPEAPVPPGFGGRRALIMARFQKAFDVRVLPPAAFCWPGADLAGLDALYVRNLDYPEAYCLNLWPERAGPLYAGLDPRSVAAGTSSLTSLARRCVDPDLLDPMPVTRVSAQGLRLNIGCGDKHLDGYVNIDRRAMARPDLCFDIEADAWPIETDGVTEVAMVHVLEHVGPGLRHVIRELYRVCRHDALIRIEVPHYRDGLFLIDPTVLRRFHPEFFYGFDRALALQRVLDGESRSPLALDWDVDFTVVAIEVGNIALRAPDHGPVLSDGVDTIDMPRERPFFERFRDPDIRVTLRANKPDLSRDAVSSLFAAVDEDWYLARNPDVAEAVARGSLSNATEHYVWFGHHERRMPRAIAVDEDYYLETYPDVRQAVAAGAFPSGQAHFDSTGYREGRQPRAD